MKILFIASLLFLTSLASVGHTLLIRKFGNAKDKPLLFLHNGSGYNFANFEGTIAKKLAENGFYVIVYMTNVSGENH
jgi:proline iminopeptidase